MRAYRNVIDHGGQNDDHDLDHTRGLPSNQDSNPQNHVYGTQGKETEFMQKCNADCPWNELAVVV